MGCCIGTNVASSSSSISSSGPRTDLGLDRVLPRLPGTSSWLRDLCELEQILGFHDSLVRHELQDLGFGVK